MTAKTFTQMERRPDEGYTITRITVAADALTTAADDLNTRTTQELTALAARLEAETTAQQAYWGKYVPRTEE